MLVLVLVPMELVVLVVLVAVVVVLAKKMVAEPSAIGQTKVCGGF